MDTEIAQGFPEPEWATQLREAIAEMNAPEPSEDEADWQRFIRMYAEEIGPTPTAEQAMLLKYFKEAGRICRLMTHRTGFTPPGVSST